MRNCEARIIFSDNRVIQCGCVAAFGRYSSPLMWSVRTVPGHSSVIQNSEILICVTLCPPGWKVESGRSRYDNELITAAREIIASLLQCGLVIQQNAFEDGIRRHICGGTCVHAKYRVACFSSPVH